MVLYIQASKEDEVALINRAKNDPKPLYYRESFLDEQLAIYMEENKIAYVALIEPDEFVRWIFPRLFYSRIPRYERIAEKYGYTVTTEEVGQVTDESSFLEMIETAISRQS